MILNILVTFFRERTTPRKDHNSLTIELSKLQKKGKRFLYWDTLSKLQTLVGTNLMLSSFVSIGISLRTKLTLAILVKVTSQEQRVVAMARTTMSWMETRKTTIMVMTKELVQPITLKAEMRLVSKTVAPWMGKQTHLIALLKSSSQVASNFKSRARMDST